MTDLENEIAVLRRERDALAKAAKELLDKSYEWNSLNERNPEDDDEYDTRTRPAWSALVAALPAEYRGK